MIEKLLANPFTGDGTLHPDLHLIYVDEVCGLFKLAGMPEDVMKKKVFPLYLKGKALTWFRLCDDIGSWNSCLLHNLLLVDVVGPPSAEVCRTVANFPQVDDLRFINPWEA